MTIQALVNPVTPFAQNAPIIFCSETNKCAFVDPGGDADFLLQIAKENNLIPEKIEEGKDAKFKATFEVYPDISLTKMNKISYTNFLCDISDEDLENTVSNLQKRLSQWEPVDDVSKTGDQVKINFVGKIEGEEFEGGTADDFTVELGSKSMIEGFEDGLIGLKRR